ncbi:MAG: HAD family hydrolase, partial [Sphingobacteriales bacterium]
YKGSGFEDQIRQYHIANQGISRFVKFRHIAANMLQKDITEEEVQDLGNQFSAIVLQKVLVAPFVPGAEQLLQFLKSHSKYTVVASGTPEEELLEVVSQRKLGGYFDEVHGSPKSKSGIIESVLDRKKFSKSACIFFGDATTDYEAARQTGIAFFARWTEELAPYWATHPADFSSPHFQNIL